MRSRSPFGSGPSLRRIAAHEPPTIRTAYWNGVAGDFDNDGNGDLAIVDGSLPGMQILAGSSGAIERALAIPVFEKGPTVGPDNEPREIAAGDVDGDGRTDLVVIAHDRVLVYLQEK